jgi:aryl-alcohol dehydrogenase-like predicted oxidoreductase
VPIAETAHAMHDLITQGKVLYWGTSEWSADEIRAAHRVCNERNLHAPVVEQPQYNLFHRARFEKEYGPLYEKPGLGTTIWSPLASGILTGKYASGIPQDTRFSAPGMEWLRDQLLNDPSAKGKIAAVSKINAIAQELGTSLPRLALAWCLKNPHVSSVILGASRVEQLTENFGALDVVDQLTPEVMRRLDAISKPVAT